MNKTILILEDNTIIAHDLKEIVQEMGHNAIVDVSDANHAKTILQSTVVDLVLIDINSHNTEDSINLANCLLKKDTVPYLFITSEPTTEILDLIKQTRPYGCLVKPYKKIDIVTNITITLNNFIHRKIDIQRQNVEIKSEIPFILKKSIEYIDCNIFEKIDINDVVASTKWSYYHFLRIFKQYVGLSPYQYVLKKKIEKAQALLIETDLPISQIGYKLGFDSHGTFSNTFKKTIGKSPESFRKQKAIEDRFL